MLRKKKTLEITLVSELQTSQKILKSKPWIFIGRAGCKLKLNAGQLTRRSAHWKRPVLGRLEAGRERQQKMRCLDGISMVINLSKLWMVMDLGKTVLQSWNLKELNGYWLNNVGVRQILFFLLLYIPLGITIRIFVPKLRIEDLQPLALQ